MKGTMTGTLLNLIVVLGLFMGALYLMQPALVFLPSRELQTTPADWGLEYQDLWLTAGDGVRLHGWYLPSPGSRRVLLFFHGNAGNISHRGASIEIFHRLGLAVLILDYRGYGRSEGSPSETGLYRDAVAAWDYLVGDRGIAPGDIVVFGRSLGGAVAAHLAAEVAPGALILESTFSSARDFVRAAYPLLSRLIVLRFAFDTESRLANLRCPVLVLHSPDDEIVPYALGQKVFRAAAPPREFVNLSGDHNGGFLTSQPRYERALAGFINKHLSPD